MKQRPIIKLELTTTDKAIELLGWISIMAIWLLTIISYPNLTICLLFIPIAYYLIKSSQAKK